MKLVWATDIHLDFAPEGAAQLLAQVNARDAQALLLTGDIATASRFSLWTEYFERHSPCPVWFVLGNHDFYGGSVASVRAQARELTASSRRVRWLGATGAIPLAQRTALVGHDGWGDAGYGKYLGSEFHLNDSHFVRELVGIGRVAEGQVMRRLGAESADHLRRVLAETVEGHERIIVLTHVPPFHEVARYKGKPTEEQALPFFVCKSTGDVLLEFARSRPDRDFMVLCGHTHAAGEARILPNLRIVAGAAEYGAPRLQPGLMDA